MPEQFGQGKLNITEGVCELCGHVTQLGALEIHRIVPQEVTEQTGISATATATLCHNCHKEIHDWYARNVSTVAYNPVSKSFQPKSVVNLVKEYEGAFRVFTEYKKSQRDIA